MSKKWRPGEGWDEKIALENVPHYAIKTAEFGNILHGITIGADAILEDLLKLAKESPTGTFTIDSKEISVFHMRDLDKAVSINLPNPHGGKITWLR